MKERPRYRVLWSRFTFFLYFFLSAALDTAFLAAWILLQSWFHQNVVVPYGVEGIDGTLLDTFQFTFGLATLIPVLSYVLVDIVSIIFNTVSAFKSSMAQ